MARRKYQAGGGAWSVQALERAEDVHRKVALLGLRVLAEVSLPGHLVHSASSSISPKSEPSTPKDIAVPGRRKLVGETCNILVAEMGCDVKTSAWGQLIELRPEAGQTAVGELEGRVSELLSHEPGRYSEDAQLMLGLSLAINAKAAVSSWPMGLAMLQEHCTLSLAQLFEAEAVTVQPQWEKKPHDPEGASKKPIGPEGAYGAC
eukprot:1615855-Prymnesium_polylepis.1